MNNELPTKKGEDNNNDSAPYKCSQKRWQQKTHIFEVFVKVLFCKHTQSASTKDCIIHTSPSCDFQIQHNLLFLKRFSPNYDLEGSLVLG